MPDRGASWRAPVHNPRWPATDQPRTSRLRRFLLSSWLVRGVLIVIILLSVTVGLLYWHLAATNTNFPGAHFNHGQNAVWLEHTWAGASHSTDEYAALAATLTREQVRYVFVHVGPLSSDGTIPSDLAPFAGNFAAALHARVPGIRVLAWIGAEEKASGLPADEVVDLADPAVRARIAATANDFVQHGMDGVHYDIEPIENNSLPFIQLLDTTRSTLPSGAMLSVAAEKWAPNAHLASWAYAAGKAGSWWTTYYYALVAQHVDQLVVMTYNTGMPTASLYSLLVKQETQNIIEAAQTAPHPPQVLMGLPTYSDNGPFFHADAETIGNGLAGVTDGLNSLGDSRAFVGVALYRFGTTTPTEWATYERQWLGK